MDNISKQTSFKLDKLTVIESVKADWFALLCISILLIILKLDGTNFANTLEATTINFAQNMLQTRDFLILQLAGVNYFTEGPLIVWLNALLIKVFGVNPLIHRLLIGIISAITIGGTYYLLRQQYNSRVAWIAIMLVLSSPLFFILSGKVNSEIIFIGLTLQAILSFRFIVDSSQANTLVYIILYVSLGLTFLIYGLLAIVYLFLVGFFYWLLTKNYNYKKIFSAIGLLILLMVVLPWLILASNAKQEFLRNFLLLGYWENLVFFDIGQFISIFLLLGMLLIASFPWGILVVYALMGGMSNFLEENEFKFFISNLIAGLLVFIHLQIHELAICGILLLPIAIAGAKFINMTEFDINDEVVEQSVFYILLSAIMISLFLIVFTMLQVNISEKSTWLFIILAILILYLPYSCKRVFINKGLYGVYNRMLTYNILSLTMISQYHVLKFI